MFAAGGDSMGAVVGGPERPAGTDGLALFGLGMTDVIVSTTRGRGASGLLRNLVYVILRSNSGYLYKVASGQICRSRDQLGSSAGVPERQMAGPNPLKGPTNILELL